MALPASMSDGVTISIEEKRSPASPLIPAEITPGGWLCYTQRGFDIRKIMLDDQDIVC